MVGSRRAKGFYTLPDRHAPPGNSRLVAAISRVQPPDEPAATTMNSNRTFTDGGKVATETRQPPSRNRVRAAVGSLRIIGPVLMSKSCLGYFHPS